MALGGERGVLGDVSGLFGALAPPRGPEEKGTCLLILSCYSHTKSKLISGGGIWRQQLVRCKGWEKTVQPAPC